MILLLVGLMLLPMVASTRVEFIHNVAGSFVGNIGLSLVVTLLMFGLFPPLPSARPPLVPGRMPMAGAETEKAQGSLASEPQPGGGPLEKC